MLEQILHHLARPLADGRRPLPHARLHLVRHLSDGLVCRRGVGLALLDRPAEGLCELGKGRKRRVESGNVGSGSLRKRTSATRLTSRPYSACFSSSLLSVTPYSSWSVWNCSRPRRSSAESPCRSLPNVVAASALDPRTFALRADVSRVETITHLACQRARRHR
jgi:hypothetical protein